MLSQFPKSIRRSQALFFSYINATYCYHQQASDHHPARQVYAEWLEGLPPSMSKAMAAKGFEECQAVPSFTRYVQEKLNSGLEEYVRSMMGEEEYREYKELIA